MLSFSGYGCKGPCTKDSQCQWKNNACYNKKTGLPGTPIVQCTPSPTASPTQHPTRSPTLSPTTPAPTMMCDKNVDIMWAMDESNSILYSGTLFDDMKTVVSELISCPTSLEVCKSLSTGTARHALVTFSGESYFEPTTYSNIGLQINFTSIQSELFDPLSSRAPAGGFTRIDRLLAYANSLFSTSSGRRKILVLLADGMPSDEFGFPGTPIALNRTLEEATTLITGSGVEVILVKTYSVFPTRNDEQYLEDLISLELDFSTLKESDEEKNNLLDVLYSCI